MPSIIVLIFFICSQGVRFWWIHMTTLKELEMEKGALLKPIKQALGEG